MGQSQIVHRYTEKVLYLFDFQDSEEVEVIIILACKALTHIH